MKTYLQLLSATFKDLVRDWMSIFWFLAFPLLFILLFGAIFSGNDGDRKFRVGLVVEASGPMGAGVKKAFASVPVFELHVGDKETELKALKTGQRSMVVVVPAVSAPIVPDADKTEPMAIPVYYDPGNTTTFQILLTTVREIFSEMERRATGRPKLFDPQPEQVSVTKLKNIDYLLPGILAMALMQLGLFGSLNYVSLRERKIIRRLGATPLPRHLVLWSEITVRLGMALIQTIMIILVGNLVYGVTITGNLFAVLGMVILGATVFISLGYFLTTFTKTEESSQGLIQVVQFPMMFLSGIFFSIDLMPSFLKPVINFIPLTYLGDGLRHIMVGLPSVYGLGTDLLIPGAWLIIPLALAIRFFRWD